jgi:hypothetical protein
MIVDRNIHMTADFRAVEETDPEGAFLLFPAGLSIPDDLAQACGIALKKGKLDITKAVLVPHSWFDYNGFVMPNSKAAGFVVNTGLGQGSPTRVPIRPLAETSEPPANDVEPHSGIGYPVPPEAPEPPNEVKPTRPAPKPKEG